ncbi:hypothetical protein EZJ49_10890 [Bdellovibrio bacteriovorus]|uniref:hypothetical protein n=1 Tax=Bdellovibrio bacteriovorus TaxID=959 RepID=UPI0021D017E2|nr:hypothetical protein [Bdellovibrio bacteriovorus]UXR63581.1 hypothetical protein EZJ49_10890 [Bdellovibrio bacteriovorus]
MRILLFVLMMLSVSASFAGTRGQFLGMQFIVNIASVMYDGSNDSSPQILFEAMDRPEQDSMIGRGKVLESPQKVLNFICARKGENNYHCAIYIHKSALGRIAPGKAYFDARGEQARALFEQFHTENGRLSFKDGDGLFQIEATPERFVMKFDAQGV